MFIYWQHPQLKWPAKAARSFLWPVLVKAMDMLTMFLSAVPDPQHVAMASVQQQF